jgi:hypothetical protein
MAPTREARKKKGTDTFYLGLRKEADLWYGIYCPVSIKTLCLYTENCFGKRTRLFDPICPTQNQEGFIVFPRPIPLLFMSSNLGIEYTFFNDSLAQIKQRLAVPNFLFGALLDKTRSQMPKPYTVSIGSAVMCYSIVFEPIPSSPNFGTIFAPPISRHEHGETISSLSTNFSTGLNSAFLGEV